MLLHSVALAPDKHSHLFFKSHSFSGDSLKISGQECPAIIREEEMIHAMGLLYPTRQGPPQFALVDPVLSSGIRLGGVWRSLPALTVL